MKVSARVTFDNQIGRYRVASERKMVRVLTKQGRKILKSARDEYVPVVTGNLRSTGKVEEPDLLRSGDGGYHRASVNVSFGGDQAPYALAVHEAPPDWGQGKNKFLTKAVDDHREDMRKELEVEMIRWRR